jgi:hypothetical protein
MIACRCAGIATCGTRNASPQSFADLCLRA